MNVPFKIVLFSTLMCSVCCEFWTTTTIDSITFDGSCVTATNCIIAKSSFLLNLSLPEFSESRIIQFPAIQLTERLSFLNHFEVGNPDSAQIGLGLVMPIGSSPLRQIHFCDEAMDVQLQEQRYERKMTYSRYVLKGRCFTAAITIEKHVGPICPPCMQPEVAHLNQTFSTAMFEKLNDPFVIVPTCLSIVLLFTTILICCYCCYRQKQENKHDYYVSKSPGFNNVVKPTFMGQHFSPATTASYVNSKYLRNQAAVNMSEAPQLDQGQIEVLRRIELHSGKSELVHNYAQIEVAASEVFDNYDYETPKQKSRFEKAVKLTVKAASEMCTPEPSVSSDEGVLMT